MADVNLEELLQKGIQSQSKGLFGDAESFYRQILQQDSLHVEANYKMGTLAFQLSQYTLARAFMLHTLQLDNNHIKAHYYLARSLTLLGDVERAIDVFLGGIRLHPLWTPPYLALGSLYRSIGRGEDSIQLYDMAWDIGVHNVNILSKKANCFLEKGEVEFAINLYRQAIQLDDNHFESWNNLGQAQVSLGKIDAALQSLLQACALRGEVPTVHRNLAEVYSLLQQYSMARKHAEKALLLGDVSREIFRISLRIYQIQQSYVLAVDLARLAIEKYPQDLSFMLIVADNLNNLKCWDEAMQEYTNILGINSQHLSALHRLGILKLRFAEQDQGRTFIQLALSILYNTEISSMEEGIALGQHQKAVNFIQAALLLIDLGNIYQQTARFPQAIHCYRGALKQDPTQVVCYRYLAGMNRYLDAVPLIKEIEKVEQDSITWTKEQRVDLYFAKGMLFDSQRQFAQAFAAFEQANQLYRSVVDYCLERSQRHIDLIKDVCGSMEWVAEPTYVKMDVQPIFIVGMIRSGSSLLAELLSAHSQITSVGETTAFSDSIEEVCQRGDVLSAMKDLSTDQIDLIRRCYQRRIEKQSRGTQTWIINKLNHNYLYVGLIRKIFPKAKIIHIQRDPRATGLSIFQRHFSEPQYFAYSLEEIVQYYQQYQSIMEYWEETTMSVFNIQYEDVIANPKREIQKLFAEWGLNWEEKQLNFYQRKDPVVTASAVQVRQPIYRGSIEKWKNYQSYIKPLLLLSLR